MANISWSANAEQFKMSEALYYSLIKYLNENRLTIKDFCAQIGLPKCEYMIRKIINRNIQMYAYKSLLDTIAYGCGVLGEIIVGTK